MVSLKKQIKHLKKKTNKTPKNEINIAKECKNKYYRSIENERPK